MCSSCILYLYWVRSKQIIRIYSPSTTIIIYTPVFFNDHRRLDFPFEIQVSFSPRSSSMEGVISKSALVATDPRDPFRFSVVRIHPKWGDISTKISPKFFFFCFYFSDCCVRNEEKWMRKMGRTYKFLMVSFNKRDQKDEFEDEKPWYTKFGKGGITP